MDVSKIYGCKVFNDAVMRQRLPARTYASLKSTNKEGLPLDPNVAEVVAGAMKDWAISLGATHYTHWFQPMTNVTAGKHDAFISPTPDGSVILEFSGKALVQGEPDASSFPSGGLRATFEARGYTAWDPTSPAFVRDGTLYIPTAFCSYTGEALDMKTPLMRSMQAISKQAVRVLRQFGNTQTKRVIPTVGAEQEYFLIDRELYEKRLDLKICGRTLLGAKPSKGQELDDHYCGRIRLRVADFMQDLDRQLWELGIPSKTKHNEAAPAQHELAPVFGTLNIACDHNQLTMEMLRIVAKKHGLACLLHEKPFSGVNGSGKHNNWSITTDDGQNLLEPGKTPWENLQFLTFLCAVITAVDRHGDLLRFSAACAGNDHRLGACEAPPSVISVFLGDELTDILESIANGSGVHHSTEEMLQMGVATLPALPKDASDRNRTSPFAFTGNKFEFRMLGSSQSIAMCNVVLNVVVADVLAEYADRLEKTSDFDREIKNIVTETMQKHGRIIFNGNNYSGEWLDEARRRGLPVLSSSVEAFERFAASENVSLFVRHAVFSQAECHSRYEIMLENYSKVLSIEAATLLEMAKRQVLPAVIRYAGQVASSYNAITAAGCAAGGVKLHLNSLDYDIEQISRAIGELELAYNQAQTMEDLRERDTFLHDELLHRMEILRDFCDRSEQVMDSACWPFPTYTDLLHRV